MFYGIINYELVGYDCLYVVYYMVLFSIDIGNVIYLVNIRYEWYMVVRVDRNLVWKFKVLEW